MKRKYRGKLPTGLAKVMEGTILPRGRRLSPLEWITVLLTCGLLFYLPFACSPSSSTPASVSGKTVYRDVTPSVEMALEDVAIRVFRWQGESWDFYTETRSGYHGSFIVHLPEGKYLLTARTTLRKTTGKQELAGILEGLVISSTDRRVDRVVIWMRPADP